MRSRLITTGLITAVLLAEMPTKSSANEGYLINDQASATRYILKLKRFPIPNPITREGIAEYCKTAKIDGQLIFAPTRNVQNGCYGGIMKVRPKITAIK